MDGLHRRYFSVLFVIEGNLSPHALMIDTSVVCTFECVHVLAMHPLCAVQVKGPFVFASHFPEGRRCRELIGVTGRLTR